MDNLLITTINDTVFLQFGKIIREGKIIISDEANNFTIQHEIANTNFEKIKIKTGGGVYLLKIFINNELITKKITIN